MINVVVVNRSCLSCNLIAAALRREPDMRVTGSADSPNEALGLLKQCPCDVVLVSTNLSDSGALDLIRALRSVSSAKILVTYPPQVDGGSVEGTYSPDTVGAGDRLKGRLGFLLNSEGNCGPGQVVFRIRYQDGSSIRLLGEWRKSCDGKLLPIDVDLGELRGRTVSFILIVDSAGSFGGDRAFWSSLRIER